MSQIYGTSLSILTDLYQLTMIYSSWKTGALGKEAVFDLYFRSSPFKNGYAVCAGLDSVLDFVANFQFSADDAEYLASLNGNNGSPLFEKGFIDYLKGLRLTVDIHAIEEGRVVFANEPLIRVTGPLVECQLLETAFLNSVNFQTLIATKAARVREAAGTQLVVEFGLRRAQGVDGSLSASRAAFIGGVDATSNVLAGKLYGIPVKGTHAHSWVMAFDYEEEAFDAFAEAMPDNCVFLVDTYHSLEGTKNAIKVGLKLREKGHEMVGIRLDSGDLAYLSVEARRMLDEAGFPDAVILASNDLDETIISSLKHQGAAIGMWGVGTKLVTGNDQPALGGVFKLMAIREGQTPWKYKMKLSEQASKTTTPGIHQVRRFFQDGHFAGDMIYNLEAPPQGDSIIVDPEDLTRRKTFSKNAEYEDLLKPVVRGGKVIYDRPNLEAIKATLKNDLQKLHPTIRRLLNPHGYPVGLELGLHQLKSEMILKLR